MAGDDSQQPRPTQRTRPKKGDPVEIPVPEWSEVMGLVERTVTQPDPDKERAWWAWWQDYGQAHLTLLLREQWNPIGDDDVPASEYAGYATRLGGLLREGISEDEMAAYLADARTGSLGLPADPDSDRRVAAGVHAWCREARRAGARRADS